MKDEYLINYKIYCQRKNFSLYRFLVVNKMSYKEIQDFFRKKSVTPPTIEYYHQVLDKIKDDQEKEIAIKKKVSLKENIKTQKPKRRRRRSKKNEQA